MQELMIYLSIFSALLGLSFLIFIHELGHYFLARINGMKVETFSIGFGRPILRWHWDDVEWRIGWILCGGYVRIAGTESSGGKDPYMIRDGFYGRGPLARIWVLLAGPVMNLLFALIVFTALWGLGGREKRFAEFSNRVGALDPKSELFEAGVRSGDTITAYDQRPFRDSKDHIYGPMFSDKDLIVEGIHQKTKKPFSYAVTPYPHPQSLDVDFRTSGILSSASYLLYNRLPGSDGKWVENPLPKGSPMKTSGLRYGDRLFWMDGHVLYSLGQLKQLLGDRRAFVRVKRGSDEFFARIPRVAISELKLDPSHLDELSDWQFETGLQESKLSGLIFTPYDLNSDCTVEKRIRLLGAQAEETAFPRAYPSNLEKPLQEGDRIIAVDGVAVEKSYQLFRALQERLVHIIVERGKLHGQIVPEKTANAAFQSNVDWSGLEAIQETIGKERVVKASGRFHLLEPVTPIPLSEMPTTAAIKEARQNQYEMQKKRIEKVGNDKQRQALLKRLRAQEKNLVLGVPAVQDLKVIHNPNPLSAFWEMVEDTFVTLRALVTGNLQMKWLSGPVGMVQVVQYQWQYGLKEVLYWLALISLNIGLLNLLPIPVLDGGHICFAVYEMVTGHRLSLKIMERMIVPFVLLFMGLIAYLTLNDVSRIFQALFGF